MHPSTLATRRQGESLPPVSSRFLGLPLWALSSLSFLAAILYYRVLAKLVFDWYNLPDFAHGFLVSGFVLYLVWNRRHALAAVPVQPRWSGILLVACALLLLVAGVFGAELFLARISGILLLVGLVFTFAGSPALRLLSFPLALLLLAVPIPALLFNQITFPLQLFASHIAAAILPLFNVPVLREGNVMQLPNIRLEVAEACSGIRSLMSLFSIAVLYGYLLERSVKWRVVLALASIPIAVAVNVLRVVVTGLCVQYWDPEKALGFFHEFSGWLMFVFSLGLLYLLQRAFSSMRGTQEPVA